MFRTVCLIVCAFLASCTSRNDRSSENSKARQADAVVMPESILFPQDSPMLQQLKVEAVGTALVPTDEITAPGKIEVNPNRVSHIVLPVTGQVTDVLVKIGDFVRKGEPVLSIRSPDADAALSAQLQADAGVTQATSAEAKAKNDYERSKDLFTHDAIAQKEVLAAETAWTQAKAGLDQAVAAREQAKNRLAVLGLKAGYFQQPVTVRAPISGKVLEMSVVPGEYRNDTNASLITIADLDTIWVSAEVPESYIRFIQLQEKIELSLIAYPDEVFEGRVSRIADTVNAQTRTVKVQAEIQNPHGKLRPEMFGTIHHAEPPKLMPVLPPAALIQTGAHNIVFLEVSPRHFKQVEVTVGKRYGDLLPVIAGVQLGDKVVVDGAMLLKGFFRSLT